MIQDTTYTLHELIFKVEKPKQWNFIQSRDSSRKPISRPLSIVFADETTEIIG